ncbi:hypothetical protein GCM10023176_24400 [Micromonospora coerulea]|uniref:Uncharacterized protein n=1 Tax=Micromonospora coerulea TaxID=47856 RepID=A0ABP8SGN0_9ACTN
MLVGADVERAVRLEQRAIDGVPGLIYYYRNNYNNRAGCTRRWNRGTPQGTDKIRFHSGPPVTAADPGAGTGRRARAVRC